MTDQTNITLREGLEKFYAENSSDLSHMNSELSKEARDFFYSHDIVHVLFGCDISLFGEGAVKFWTIFGTTLGFWNHLKAYKEANAYTLAKNFSFAESFGSVMRLLISIPLIIYRANKMNKPWPWSEFESYLDVSIYKIRREFNIRVIDI